MWHASLCVCVRERAVALLLTRGMVGLGSRSLLYGGIWGGRTKPHEKQQADVMRFLMTNFGSQYVWS